MAELIFDKLPDRRIRASERGWSTRWYTSPLRLALLIPAIITPLFTTGSLTLTGVILSIFLVAIILLDPAYSTRVEASWDAASLSVDYGGRHTWNWADIDAVELTKKHLVIRSGESETQIPLPPDKEGLGDILPIWKAHLRNQPLGPGPTRDVGWTFRESAVRAGVRLRGGAPCDERSNRQRSVVLSTAGVAFVVSAIMTLGKLAIAIAPIFDLWLPMWSGAATTAGLVIAGTMTPLVAALLVFGRRLQDNRPGFIEMDAHKVTFGPVDKHPHAILWERILDIGGDDCTLWLDTEDGRFEYDVTREHPARVNQLRADLIHRWSNVRDAIDDPVEAAQRREQLAALVGGAHHPGSR